GLSHLREGPLIGGQDFRPRRDVFRAQRTYNVISKTLFTTLCFWGAERPRGGAAEAPGAVRRQRRDPPGAPLRPRRGDCAPGPVAAPVPWSRRRAGCVPHG